MIHIIICLKPIGLFNPGNFHVNDKHFHSSFLLSFLIYFTISLYKFKSSIATPPIAHESFAWEYDVFLSFRGEDTRKTFTDHLYSALCQTGIRTFRDDEELRKGEYLAPELTRAIQNSKISMIVFSKDYASSRWCLDEVLQIVECKEKGKQIVFPIFYDVDPSQVRKQSGNYGLAFAKHEERFGKGDKVQNWRDALTKVADMSGWDLQGITNGYESNFINAIIKEVRLKI
ncbi:PREDICTED: toll/interleukin-1 receptor-like protein [Ipomoea nil]|uniref:toll/interleukin-1 receptor-like protein n=1 Tax=Ipomoea nil TaxID=35883 RepID=UPI000901729E|nr:PREDICTED: toll/interleukin-1 receptor-like protein [Ipomoea nil]